MEQIDYEQAVQTLRSHLGTRYEGVEADGRDEMTSVLKSKLGYSDHEAEAVIALMISSGVLRYRRPGAEDDAASMTGAPAVGAIPATGVAGTVASSAGAAPIIPIPVTGGYWQIGTDDEPEGGRKGQATPA